MDSYEKKYKEALEKARQLCAYPTSKPFISDMQDLFPELKKSEDEDERIRKELIGFLRNIPNSNYTCEEMALWLEKQGEKTADKIEPKFNVGDWITNGDYTWKVIKVEQFDYILQSQDGNIVDDTISHVDEQFHSFTIKDAKDGDVLIDKSGSREGLFIFKETKPSDIKTDVLNNPLTVLGYCGIGGAGFTKGSGWGDTANCTYYPATKEQRDQLEKAMANAGYTFNFEKKELKKIKQKPQRMVSAEAKEALYDKPTDEEMKELLRTEYEKGKADAFSLMQKEWSEEDEERIKNILSVLDVQVCWNGATGKKENPYQKEINWLKSLKDRAQPQPKQEWSEENDDDAWMNDIISKVENNLQLNKAEIDFLKSLKDRVKSQNTWKPSDKQMEALRKAEATIGVNHVVLAGLISYLEKLKE